MKRMICAAALAAALVTGVGGDAMAHRITVDTPGAGVVRERENLAREITPRLFPDSPDDNDELLDSAASQGTNTACEAIPEQSAVTITGGTC